MTAVTYGASASALKTKPARVAASKTGLLSRFWTAFVAARMAQAEREIALHRHLLPSELERAAGGISRRSEDQLPFMR